MREWSRTYVVRTNDTTERGLHLVRVLLTGSFLVTLLLLVSLGLSRNPRYMTELGLSALAVLTIWCGVPRLRSHPRAISWLVALAVVNVLVAVPELMLRVVDFRYEYGSSHQGRVVAERHGHSVDPDRVVVYFGWNAHWQAYGAVDADKVVPTGGRSQEIVRRLLRKTRLVQPIAYLRSRLSGHEQDPLGRERVPVEAYEENLDAIGQMFADRGTPVLFITAPTAPYGLGIPDSLEDLRLLESRARGLELHGSYNQLVRRVASLENAHLCDLVTRDKRASIA
jgi:hypothetical protein